MLAGSAEDASYAPAAAVIATVTTLLVASTGQGYGPSRTVNETVWAVHGAVKVIVADVRGVPGHCCVPFRYCHWFPSQDGSTQVPGSVPEYDTITVIVPARATAEGEAVIQVPPAETVTALLTASTGHGSGPARRVKETVCADGGAVKPSVADVIDTEGYALLSLRYFHAFPSQDGSTQAPRSVLLG